MILQPIVENAIKHGIAPRSQGGTVKIESVRNNGNLLLTVADNGVGLADTDLCDSRRRRLENQSAFLRHLYGENHNFEIAAGDDGGVRLRLTIPYKTEDED